MLEVYYVLFSLWLAILEQFLIDLISFTDHEWIVIIYSLFYLSNYISPEATIKVCTSNQDYQDL